MKAKRPLYPCRRCGSEMKRSAWIKCALCAACRDMNDHSWSMNSRLYFEEEGIQGAKVLHERRVAFNAIPSALHNENAHD